MIETYSIERDVDAPFTHTVVYSREGLGQIKSMPFKDAAGAIAALTLLLELAAHNCGIKPLVYRWEDDDGKDKGGRIG